MVSDSAHAWLVPVPKAVLMCTLMHLQSNDVYCKCWSLTFSACTDAHACNSMQKYTASNCSFQLCLKHTLNRLQRQKSQQVFCQ